MLHKSKGKYKWQTKATWCIEHSLNPVILAYLEKLYSFKDKGLFGIPMSYIKKQAALQGIEDIITDFDKVDEKAAFDLYIRDLEELIWTFSDNEPNILGYQFEYDWLKGDDVRGGLSSITLSCSNQVERDRYNKDLDEWYSRKNAGYKLFGEIYTDLDW